MNAVAPSASRRHFLTSLFSASDTAAARTELRPVPGLPAQTSGVLWAIAGNDPDDIFIAGDDGLVFHFDGESWQLEEFPSSLNVHSLCSTGDRVFSVGWMGQICVRENGAWNLVQGGGSDAATINQPLFDIEAADDGRLWAVGDCGRITEYTDGQWCEHKSGSSSNLRAVLPLANGNVLAAGLGGTVLEYNGNSWRNIETGTGCPIVSMARLPDDRVLAVGGEYSIETNEFVGRLFHYEEGNWSAIATDYPLPRLRRVRCEGSNLLIVADAGQAFRWTGDGVGPLVTRVRYDLHDVISFEGGGALICGDNGAVLQECSLAENEVPALQTHNFRWQLMSQGETNKTLRALWAIDDDHLIAAGDGGTVMHINGDKLSLQSTPGNLCIHALWGSSPGNIFAVCDNATILHFDGENWQVAHRGSRDTALLAITGFGPHDIFAVGDSGYALRYDGLMWREIETGVKQELYGLWGHDSQHLLAVGGGGLVMRWNGERWKQFTAGTDYDLYGVSGSGLSKLFLCGLSGTLVRFEDNAWHREFTGVRSDLHAIAGHDSNYYVVGSNGTILGNSDSTWMPENCGVTNTLQAVAVNGSGVLAVGSGGTVLRRVISS